MWKKYFTAIHEDEVLNILEEKKERARIVVGATDLILEIEKGMHPGVDTMIDISRVSEFSKITLDDEGFIHLGPTVTHTDVVGSPMLREKARPLVQACWEIGSPQIRNRGSVIGNLVTASPANDTISPLMALSAKLVLRSSQRQRTVDLADFYTGVRQTVLEPDEMVAEVVFPAMNSHQQGMYVKHALRNAQAISLLNVVVVLSVQDGVIDKAAVTLGAVAPTIIHAVEAENWLVGRQLNEETALKAGQLAATAARPIDDIRSSAAYRQIIVKTLVSRAIDAIRSGNIQGKLPDHPVLMKAENPGKMHLDQGYYHDADQPILTTINGKQYELKGVHDKTLLRLLREDAKLLGSKETCAEGECGACTVILDGTLVNSCMVPSQRAHGAQIQTVEGLADGEQLHPIQEAFIDTGAIQCGYCTPGFLMSTVKLLEERPSPTQAEIKLALSGNLCRCTGYYKIIEAVEKAALAMSKSR